MDMLLHVDLERKRWWNCFADVKWSLIKYRIRAESSAASSLKTDCELLKQIVFNTKFAC